MSLWNQWPKKVMRNRQRPGKARSLICGGEKLETRNLLAVGNVSFDFDGTGTPTGESSNSSISADGRFVAFQSTASDLVDGMVDANGPGTDIFVRDRLTKTTILVSSSTVSLTISGNQPSFNPHISANGRYVLFESRATNLTNNDSNQQVIDVFRFDTFDGSRQLISENNSGGSTLGATTRIGDAPDSNGRYISDDGRYVVFQSNAPDLVDVDDNLKQDVFVRDALFGITYMVSFNQAIGNSGDGASANPTISATGRFIAFESEAQDLVENGPADLAEHRKIFLHDLTNRTNKLLSTDSTGGTNGIDADSFRPKINFDGKVVAFESLARLAANDGNFFQDIYVRNVAQGSPVLVSADAGRRSPNAPSANPSISDDGRWVVFDSLASDLVTNDNDGITETARDVFLRNLETNTTTLVSSNSASTGSGNFASSRASINGNGTAVVFQSQATNLIQGFVHDNTAQNFDVFAYNVATAAKTLVSTARGTTLRTGNGNSFNSTISRDGRYIAFEGTASNLIGGDRNGETTAAGGVRSDVFASAPGWIAPVIGILVTQTGANTRVTEAGQVDTYRVALKSQPNSLVTVRLTFNNQLTTAPVELLFQPINWYVSQTITVRAIDDIRVEGSHASAILHTADSLDDRFNGKTANLGVSIVDNDTALRLAAIDSYFAYSNAETVRKKK